jgi:hypothetical protein
LDEESLGCLPLLERVVLRVRSLKIDPRSVGEVAEWLGLSTRTIELIELRARVLIADGDARASTGVEHEGRGR